MSWIELVGFCGSALAVWTYWMREMIPLRVVAGCFMTYGILIESFVTRGRPERCVGKVGV